jgi:hypothetical protein
LASSLDIAQKNSHDWAISARGFNTSLANKLLVLMDGRSVYTPLYSGVFWDVQDYLLEDIDRIEVISGPGGTLWGANAVNGVINITTKSAKDTYVNRLRRAGVPREAAMRLVNHASELVHQIYQWEKVDDVMQWRDAVQFPTPRNQATPVVESFTSERILAAR